MAITASGWPHHDGQFGGFEFAGRSTDDKFTTGTHFERERIEFNSDGIVVKIFDKMILRSFRFLFILRIVLYATPSIITPSVLKNTPSGLRSIERLAQTAGGCADGGVRISGISDERVNVRDRF